DVPDGPLSRAIGLKEQGVLRHISFSFHDEPPNMIEIIKRGAGVFSEIVGKISNEDYSSFKNVVEA
ncbi:MAG TPA: aldo/keto reductase, partial [Spirochaetota bacterium]|nr:aldo/keto reductase [Spirochaetota bacterium]